MFQVKALVKFGGASAPPSIYLSTVLHFLSSRLASALQLLSYTYAATTFI